MFKIAFPALWALNLFILTSAHATSIWGDGGFNGFTNTLPHADRQGVEQTLGHEWSDVIFKIGFEPNRIKKADFAHIDAVLERAVKAKLSVLDLFTMGELSDSRSFALLLDAEVLQHIDSKYDLSSVWMLSAKTKENPARILKMRYLIVGQGTLLMGYPHPATVEILDEGQQMEYRYESLILAKIINNDQNRGLFSVRSLTSPADNFGDFKGPMGVSIQGYEVQGSNIRVTYHLVVDQETTVTKKPIIIRTEFGF